MNYSPMPDPELSPSHPHARIALVTGATGATGRQLIRLLLEHPTYAQIVVLHHRATGLAKHAKVTEVLADFSKLADLEHPGGPASTLAALRIDDSFCCLGTTRKKAGSREALYQVDKTFVENTGKLAKRLGTKRFVVVSSMLANPHSTSFYLRTKGEMETALQQLSFDQLAIMRPGLLHGERDELRLAEQVGFWLCTLLGQLPGLASQRPVATRTLAAAMISAALTQPPALQIYPTPAIEALARASDVTQPD